MRKLATIEKIVAIAPIPDADAIEVATVRGWKVVVKKGEFQVGDLCVYCEVDSWIPNEIAPFLSKGQEPREYDGVKGERLRTVKLRGQISQGLILPVEKSVPEKGIMNAVRYYDAEWGNYHHQVVLEGDNVTELLGIKKYEPPVPACLAGLIAGPWPSAIPKTDQERIQNLVAELEVWKARDLHFEVTEKIDGSSSTFLLTDENELLVCSRNLNLKEDETNSFWKIAHANDMRETMIRDGLQGCAVQGELAGEGVQGNKYKLKGQEFFVYDMYSVREGYAPMRLRHVAAFDMGLEHVPVIDINFSIQGHTVESLLKYAEGKSQLNPSTEREGLVFKCIEDPSISFKAISNLFLLKNKE